MTSGVSARWLTGASALEIELRGPEDARPTDVLVDGVLHARLATAVGGALQRVALPAGEHVVELWLPQLGLVQLRSVTFWGGPAVSVRPAGLRWITYGSSITHCSAADGPSETWPALVARRYDWQLTSLGLGGQCQLDPIVARTIRDTPADLVSLCLGVNVHNASTYSARTFQSQVVGFLQTVRDGHPDTPMVVIGPIASPSREDEPCETGMTLREIRRAVASAVTSLRNLGDLRMEYVDGRSVLNVAEAPGYLHDGLHPSPDGYRLMAQRLAPILAKAAAR